MFSAMKILIRTPISFSSLFLSVAVLGLAGASASTPAYGQSAAPVTPVQSAPASPATSSGAGYGAAMPQTIPSATTTTATTTAPAASAPAAAPVHKSTFMDSVQAVIDSSPRWVRGLLGSEPPKKVPTDEERAVIEARNGQYDEPLATLSRIYQRDKSNESVARDYTAVLSWAGQDQNAVTLYQTLPPMQPDYVLAAVGHSYRVLNQPDKALTVYRLGLQQYPDNVGFAEGEIRCLADQELLDQALAKANDDIAKRGERAEIVAAKKDIQMAIVRRDEQKAVELARSKHYPESLAILSNLYAQHSDDVNITRDYMAVLGWTDQHDDQVVALYQSMPAGDQPDYVLEAAGHSYRKLHQSDKALAIYQQGLQKYPDSVTFAEGEMRSLIDLKKYDEAIALADENLHQYGNRPEIVDVRKNAIKQKPQPKRAAKHSKKHY
jgi:tetratricopeptide (TPR) repeat protein